MDEVKTALLYWVQDKFVRNPADRFDVKGEIQVEIP